MSVNWPTTDSTIANVRLAPAVDAHTEANLIPSTRGLIHAYDNSIAHDMPMISVTPSGGKFLSLLTTISGSRQVLEIGTLGGYSTIWFANALKRNGGGRVTSIEIDPSRRQVAIDNLKYAGVKVPDEAEVLLGAALDILPKLAKEITKGEKVCVPEPFGATSAMSKILTLHRSTEAVRFRFHRRRLGEPLGLL